MQKIISLTLILSIVMLTSLAQSNHKLLRHVVLFGWKANADTVKVQQAIQAFNELPAKINVIKQCEWGINSSPENLNQGLTHCFVLTFVSDKDRDAYLIHPDHVAFTKLLPDILDKVTVVDYWVQPQ